MRNATRTAVVAVLALAAVLTVAVATAAAVWTLQGTVTAVPGAAHYGDEIVITPSQNTTALPGDTVDLQYLAADNTWQKYGESLSVEDTASVDASTGLAAIGPLNFIVDDSLQYPAVIRAHFIPKDTTEGEAYSDPIWIRLIKNMHTKTVISAPSVFVHGKTYNISTAVLPDSGAGAVKVTVKQLGGRYNKAFTLITDDQGNGHFTTKLVTKGKYLITERFLGNQFGAASGIAAKIITVK